MKNIFKCLAVFAAVVSFSACQKEIDTPKEEIKSTHRVAFVAGIPETKTSVSIDKTNGVVDYAWTKDDESRFTIYEITGEGTLVPATETAGTLEGDGRMSIIADFEGSATAESSYIALFNSSVKEDQASDEQEYDQDSDVLVSQVVKSESIEDEELYLSFRREVAMAVVTLKGLDKGTNLYSVKIESNKPLAGSYDLNNKTWENTSTALNIESLNDIENGVASLYFVTIPVEEAMLKVTVETTVDSDNVTATYVKEFTKSISFTRGDVRAFNVNLEGCEAPIFYESFNTNEGTGGNDGEWSGSIASSNFNADNANWIVEKGSGANQCAKFGTGSDRGSAITPALGIDGSATLTFKAGAWKGDATTLYISVEGEGVINQPSVELVNEKFSDYSVYIAGANADTKVKFLAKQSSKSRFFLDEVKVIAGAPVFDYLTVSENNITATYNATSAAFTIVTNGAWTISGEKASGVSLSSETGTGNSTVTLSFDANESSSVKRLATLTVTAGSLSETVIISQDANPNAINTVSVADFLAAEESDILYQLTGTVKDLTNTTYGNFNLEDATGTVYIYGLAASNGAANTTFSQIGLKEGDEVTLVGKRTSHNGIPQVGSAYHVSHVSAPSLTVSPTSLQFAASGESKTVTVTAENFTGNVEITATSSNAQFTTAVSGNVVTITAVENTKSTDESGTITITASNGTKSKNVSIAVTQDGSVDTDDSGVVTFDFSTDAGLSALGITKPASSNGTEIAGEKYTLAPISFVATNGGTTPTRVWNSNGTLSLRTYNNNTSHSTITLSSSSNNVTKVEFTGSSINLSASTGSFDGNAWTGSAKNVTFTSTSGNTISKITVTYGTPEVEPVDAEWSVSPASVSVAKDATAKVTITTNYDGTLSVSSNAEGIATASIAGKIITVTGVTKGTTTLTVTGSATANYNALSKTISVNVTEVGSIPADVVFDLTTNSYDSSSEDQVTWLDNGTSAVLTKESSTTKANNYLGGTGTNNHTRMYAGQKLTISPKPGATMKSVVITSTSSSYLAPTTWNNATASSQDAVVTITPTDGTQSISATMSGARIKEIKIVYND